MPTKWGRKYFSYRGCLLPLLIYGYMKGFLQVAFRQEVMVTSTTSKNIFCGGLTLTPSNVRICERTFPRQNLIPKLPLRWWSKASPKVVSEVFSETGFTKRGLKVGISEGTFKKVSELGLTLPPPHFRISERLFKNLSPAPWLSGSQMSEYVKASFNCTLTIEYSHPP